MGGNGSQGRKSGEREQVAELLPKGIPLTRALGVDPCKGFNAADGSGVARQVSCDSAGSLARAWAFLACGSCGGALLGWGDLHRSSVAPGWRVEVIYLQVYWRVNTCG